MKYRLSDWLFMLLICMRFLNHKLHQMYMRVKCATESDTLIYYAAENC